MTTAPFEIFGLNVDWKRFEVDAFAHRHNEIEMICVQGAPLTLVFSGTSYRLEVGQSAVFWAVVPHFARESGADALLCWAKVPLAQFLAWNLPPPFVGNLLAGRFVLDPTPRPVDVSSYQYRSWREYLHTGTEDARRIVLLEIEARLREFALHRPDVNVPNPAPIAPESVRDVDRMLSFIAARYTEPIAVADIAQAAGLQPSYAMRVFRASFGMTIMDCVTRHRASHAQRLLLTTTSTVLEILLEAGFGSVAQFYAVFVKACGCTPQEYRKSMGTSANYGTLLTKPLSKAARPGIL
jgi:AraC-like DNA-binding protein